MTRLSHEEIKDHELLEHFRHLKLQGRNKIVGMFLFSTKIITRAQMLTDWTCFPLLYNYQQRIARCIDMKFEFSATFCAVCLLFGMCENDKIKLISHIECPNARTK